MTTHDDDVLAVESLLKLDTGPGPAVRIGDDASRALVSNALDEAMEETPQGATNAPRSRKMSMGLVAAAVIFGTSAAAAALYVWTDGMGLVHEDAVHSSTSPAIPQVPQEEPGPEEPVMPIIHVDEPMDGPVPADRPTRPRKVVPASELLARANQLRAQRRWRDAERAYRTVFRQHRGTPESYSAMVAAASLELEHLNGPREALRLYRQALAARPSGALAAEARYGIAAAYRKLGNREQEREALREFISKHPTSLRKTRAQTRLDSLEGE
jgi:tetratricopeptide (TPR) repeat protein